MPRTAGGISESGVCHEPVGIGASDTRIQSIDVIKIIAMYGVIAMHSTYRYIEGEFCPSFVLYALSAAAVPLFFTVSGFLLLGKQRGRWYPLRKVWGIVRFVGIMSAVWCLLYRQFSLRVFFGTFLGAFIQKGHLPGFWFLGVLVIFYLLLPVLSFIYRRAWLFRGVLLFLFLVECCVFIHILWEGTAFEEGTIQTFRLWNHLFYFMLGGLLRGRVGSKMNIGAASVAACAVMVVACMFICNKVFGIGRCELYYSSLPVMALVVCVFVTVLRHSISGSRVVALLSPLFLPVYTIHFSVVALCKWIVPEFLCNGITVFVCSGIAATVLAWGLMKVPGMKMVFRI